MGTRMVSAAESPVHDNWKRAVVEAAETDTVFLNRQHGPGLRALRTKRTEELEHATHNVMVEFGDRANVMKLYFGGELEAAVATGDRRPAEAADAVLAQLFGASG